MKNLLPSGDALPGYREQEESPRSERAKKYPLVFNSANPKYFCHTLFANDEKMLDKYMKEPHLFINSKDAEVRGISNEDIVRVYNDRGFCKTKVKISDEMPPGVVNLHYGWWPKQFIEGHTQSLISSNHSKENPDPSREIMWDKAIERMGGVDKIQDGQFDMTGEIGHLNTIYSADKLFDCLCEVEKDS